ncbi:MAG TPA: hypothetical protein VG604_00820 [Candidatus Saccharimonadales bacterium]|nr:hypothetical protein [Candidatus Saccharimonadales bacterium]
MRKNNNATKKKSPPVGPGRVKVVQVTTKSSPAPRASGSAHHMASHASGHKPQAAKTLMRSAVHKPAAQVIDENVQQALTLATVSFQPSVSRIDPKRLKHAKSIAKSKHISRFGAPAHGPAPKPLPEINPEPQANYVMPTPPPIRREQPTTSQLIERAVAHANSHQQLAPQLPGKKHSRSKLGLGLAVSLAILGVVGVQGFSAARLQVASSKAGFTAAMPSYKPAGVKLGQLNYDTGVVAMNYVSTSGSGQAFSVVEKPSDWSNQDLLNKVVLPDVGDAAYTKNIQNGTTYYLYGQHITWVKGGVWYLVTSHDALGVSQLQQIANSL